MSELRRRIGAAAVTASSPRSLAAVRAVAAAGLGAFIPVDSGAATVERRHFVGVPTDANSSKMRTAVTRPQMHNFEPAVVLQAVVSTYVACGVGVAFFLGPYAISAPGLFFALFAMLYALPPGVLTLTALYLGLRRLAVATWLRGLGCVLGGALGGLLWGGFVLLVTKKPDHFPLWDIARILLLHVVPGSVGGLIFLLFTHARMARYAEAMAHDPNT